MSIQKTFLKITIIAISVLLAVVTLVPMSMAGALDGKVFIGQSGESGKEASEEDTVTFNNGKLHSVVCDQWGFGKGEYTTTKEGSKIHLEAETTSSKHGKILWKGTVEGDSLNAVYTWTKKRFFWTTKKEYWFKGTLKK
jgi:hypothetical protein